MYGKNSFYKPKYTHESVSDMINKALKLLIEENNKNAFLDLLALRRQEFETALKQNPDPFETQRILAQYYVFAKTLSKCISDSPKTSTYVDSYLNHKNYYPVGVTKVIEEPFRHNISLAATILGAALILASFAALFFNPLITAILLPIGISLLAPGVASLLTPGPLDTSEVKGLEKLIFEAAAKVNNPELDFDDGPGLTQNATVF
ncbi:lpg1689 family Dot/Icm T4SS effector [Legionella sp. WA2024007413]